MRWYRQRTRGASQGPSKTNTLTKAALVLTGLALIAHLRRHSPRSPPALHLPETPLPVANPIPVNAFEAAIPPDGLAREFVDIPAGPRIAYVQAGEGPDLILIHGVLMTLEEMWLGPMQDLSGHFRVIALDRPGHGQSEQARHAEGSIWRQAEIVRDAAKALGLVKPTLVGHSLGGAVALAHAMAYPEDTGGVVAVSPICYPEPRLEQMLFGPRAFPIWGDALSRLLAPVDAGLLPMLWRSMFLPHAMPERFASEFPFALAGQARTLTADGESANRFWGDLTRSALGYATCRVPVRILGGSADIVTNQALHGSLAAMQIPGARFRWFPGDGHMLHHFHPEAVLEAAREVHGPVG
jgi:pimeloyl-ACP methyl ester carboxylesterase